MHPAYAAALAYRLKDDDVIPLLEALCEDRTELHEPCERCGGREWYAGARGGHCVACKREKREARNE